MPDFSSRKHLFEINLREVKLEEKVNIEELAKKSEGYSCADITTLCRDASFMAMRKRLTELQIQGLSVEEIKNIGEEMALLPVTAQDFETAFGKIQSSVSQSEISQHENWKTEFGSA